MVFDSENDAKNYVCDKCAGYLTPEQIEQRFIDYRTYLKLAHSDEDKEHWQEQIHQLEEWSNSEEYKTGSYAQGIDQLILELIEWRAEIFAFENVETEKKPFKKTLFYAQWLTGAAYAIFCILGKLVSKDSRDNSLRKLWFEVCEFVSKSGLCDVEEIDVLQDKMGVSTGHFTNENSKAMLFRNKAIAHNECSPSIEWSEIDKDIELLCRVWALVTIWGNCPVIEPFRDDVQVFSGLQSIFSDEELIQLQKQRKEYLNKAEGWCTSNIMNGERIEGRSPFAKISASIGVDRKTAS